MLRMSGLMIAAVAAVGLSFTFAPTALADDFQCAGALGAVTKDNVIVPDGATCTLNGTIVQGDIKVYAGSTLNAQNVKVYGNVQAEGASLVEVYGSSTVGGSIQVKQGGGVSVDRVTVTGDIQFESNRTAVNASRNTVNGNIQIFSNTGGASVTDNVIDGNLQCKENLPAPTGARNQAASLEDQCATFGGTPTNTPPIVNPPGDGGGGDTDDFQCTGALGAVTKDNVIVPDGATCTLTGTIVQGNIIVGTGSTLNANGVKVHGNVQAEGSTEVEVYNSARVGGSVQIKQGGGAFLDRVTVTGDIQLESNSKLLEANRNTVGGNIQVFSNTGGALITNNAIDGNLQCKQNVPAPTGSNNQAASFEDQCPASTFQGTPGEEPPVVTPPPGGGDDFVCRTTVSGNTYENVIVPDFATCTLNGSTVNGNINVGTNSTLNASAVKVDGNVQAEGSAKVTVQGNSTVGGSIQVKQGGGAFVDQVAVTGDIQFESNSAELNASRNTVNGNIQIFSNSGGVSITDNRIGGNLQCKSNVPAPTGARNVAQSLEDQCASFGGTPTNTAPAIDLTCSATFGAQTYDNVTVPSGATCTLNGSIVRGSIKVNTGATLRAFGVEVDGNLQGQGASAVTVGATVQSAAELALSANSFVGGSVQLVQGGVATLSGLRVVGDILLDDNSGRLTVENSSVGGNLQAFQNRSSVVLRSNAIDGNLQCKENSTAPVGGGNVAASLQDQCAPLGVPATALGQLLRLPSVFLRK